METIGFLGPSGTHSEAAALYLMERLGEEKSFFSVRNSLINPQ